MTTSGLRLYVIGDIHGRLDLLERMIELVNVDIKARDGGEPLIVTVGDYIDRGPNSREVIDRLLKNPFAGKYVALKGNHESLLQMFLDDPTVGADWWRLGGAATLRSFGVDIKPRMTRRAFARAAAQLREALAPQQTEFLGSLKTSLTAGRYFMCHAGVRPGVALDSQREEDLLWIRDDFLSSEIDFGKIIVHGHTPVREPENLANRINIDTGAFQSERLTCVVLQDEERRFFSTGT
jgi:serine/threonine protein phosphatase 1